MFGKIFRKSLYDRVGERLFVVYAVVRDSLLQRLWYDYAGAVVFAFFALCCHVLQQKLVCPLYTYGSYLRLCGDGSMCLCESCG